MLKVLYIYEADKWDQIVKSFKDYDAYYLSGYTKAFQLHGDGEPLLFYYEDYNIKAMNVMMKRDIGQDKKFLGQIPKDLYFDITTPYGYGGFIIEGEATIDNLVNLNNQYSAFCEKEGIVSEFVRFHPILKNNDIMKNIYEIVRLGKTISMDTSSIEEIWSNLTSKNRNMVRKAQKSGVEIFWGRSPELYEEFIEMYNATMDKDNAKDYYYFERDFYNSILNDLKYNSIMFYAKYQGKIIAMSLILFGNKQMHYHLSASDRGYQRFAPTNLLLYEAACWGCQNGYNTFHLGGGLGSGEDGLYKFKKAFNRNSDNNFFVGRKIFDEEKYNRLTVMNSSQVNSKIKTKFFPKYRADN